MKFRISAAIVIGLSCVSAAWAQAKEPRAGETRVVRAATQSKEILVNLPLFVGSHMGFFAEEGIKLELSHFRGGTDILRALTTGAADIGATPSTGAVFIAASKGVPVKIVSSNTAIPTLLWVVAADSPLKSVKDIRGKKVGFSTPGSLTHLTLELILKTEGLDKSVEIVRVGSPGQSWTALKSNIVDVAWHVSPGVYQLLHKKEARVLFDSQPYIKEYQESVVVAMEDLIKRDPELIRAFLRARTKSIDFIWKNRDKTLEIWSKELGLPQEVLMLAYKDIPQGYWEIGAPKRENLMGSMNEILKVQAIKEPLDLSKILDPRFMSAR